MATLFSFGCVMQNFISPKLYSISVQKQSWTPNLLGDGRMGTVWVLTNLLCDVLFLFQVFYKMHRFRPTCFENCYLKYPKTNWVELWLILAIFVTSCEKHKNKGQSTYHRPNLFDSFKWKIMHVLLGSGFPISCVTSIFLGSKRHQILALLLAFLSKIQTDSQNTQLHSAFAWVCAKP